MKRETGGQERRREEGEEERSKRYSRMEKNKKSKRRKGKGGEKDGGVKDTLESDKVKGGVGFSSNESHGGGEFEVFHQGAKVNRIHSAQAKSTRHLKKREEDEKKKEEEEEED